MKIVAWLTGEGTPAVRVDTEDRYPGSHTEKSTALVTMNDAHSAIDDSILAERERSVAAIALLKRLRYHANRHTLPREWLTAADEVLGTWGPVKLDHPELKPTVEVSSHVDLEVAILSERERNASLCASLKAVAGHSSSGSRLAGAMAMAESCERLIRGGIVWWR